MFGQPKKKKEVDIKQAMQVADTRTDVESNVEAANEVARFANLPFLQGRGAEAVRIAVPEFVRSPKSDIQYQVEKYVPLLQTVKIDQIFEAKLDYTDEEKTGRVLAFLELYVQTGLRGASAKAVGVAYGVLLLWVSENPDLKLALTMAEEEIKAQYEDVAHLKAMSGDSAMVRFQIDRNSGRRVQTKGGKTAIVGGDTITKASEIMAAAAKNAKEKE